VRRIKRLNGRAVCRIERRQPRREDPPRRRRRDGRLSNRNAAETEQDRENADQHVAFDTDGV
jgi:hypothetical protein